MQIVVDNKLMQTKILLSKSKIQKQVKAVAAQINNDYANTENLIVIVIMHGAMIFAADIIRELTIPLIIESIRIKSYEGMTSQNTIELVTPIPTNIKNNPVLIIEDIIDSGKSMNFLLNLIKNAGATNIKIATLLDKPHARTIPITANYVGFNIGENFVIGYGLDLDGKYRNLPYIAELISQTPAN